MTATNIKNQNDLIGDVSRRWIQRIANATGEPQVVFQYMVSLRDRTLYASKEYFDRWIDGKYQVTVIDTVYPELPQADRPVDQIIRTEEIPIL